MENKYSVAYIGNFYKIAEYIYHSRFFELGGIIVENDKVTDELTNLSVVRNITMYPLNKKEELEYFFTRLNVDFYIMCSFGRKIPKGTVAKYEIYNIHYGKLPDYKGRHPTFWAIVSNDINLGVTLHKVTENIDEGQIISHAEVPFYIWMDEKMVFDELTEKVPMLLSDLYRFKVGEKKCSPTVRGGNYFKPVSQDNIVLTLNDNPAKIYNTIRAEARYNGAMISLYDKNIRVKKALFVQRDSGDDISVEEESLLVRYKKNIFLKMIDYEVVT